MIQNNRVLGIAVSRAFGDGPWKWNKETQEEAHKKYNGGRLRPNLKTPPYLTAEPLVTTTKIDPQRKSFLIMASDGMWDTMSSEQAVDLVGRWVDWKAAGMPKQQAAPEFDPFDLAPYYDAMWQVEERKITVEDENVAVHLVRNALGGAHHDMISGVLAFKPSRSRTVRDDITVQVVFFGDDGSA